jgi:ABC-type polysaccharide/polyol phosphate export permease
VATTHRYTQKIMILSRLRFFASELYGARLVLWKLAAQQLTLRYRRSALGFLWTLINPLVMMSFMAIVFSSLFKTDLKTFAVFLFSGMIAWNFFNSVVTQSSSSFLMNESLIKKIYLPKVIFPLSIAISALIDSVLSFISLFVIIIVLGGSLSWALLFLPISFVLLFIFSVGIGLLISIATVYFRDLQHILLIAIQGLFFLTPILYKANSLEGKVGWLVSLNPVTPFIALFRTPLIDSTVPSMFIITQTACLAFLAIGIGVLLFLRYEKQIVYRL